MSDYSAVVRVADADLQRRRLTVFFRLVLALPHFIALSAFTFAAVLMAPVAWIVTLVRGELPRELHDFYVIVVRYATHVGAYLCLAAGRWPPFGAATDYEIDIDIAGPQRQSRWTVGFRLLLAFPALLLVGALGGNLTTGAAVAMAFRFGVLPTVALLAWFSCLARGRMPRGMRNAAAYALGYTAQAYAYALLLTPRYPNSDPALLGAAAAEHPVRLRLPAGDDLRRHRLLVFFRGLVAVPHFVWATLWAVVVVVAAIGGWLFALVAGRLPKPLHRFFSAYVRYQAHVYGFVLLAAEPFPGFTGAPGASPIEVDLPEPGRHGRWSILFRALLALPAALLAGALSAAQYVAVVLAWFAALFTGRMPRGLRNLIAFGLRYSAQLMSYGLLLTREYPDSGPGRCD